VSLLFLATEQAAAAVAAAAVAVGMMVLQSLFCANISAWFCAEGISSEGARSF
jgi:hypothetical protein